MMNSVDRIINTTEGGHFKVKFTYGPATNRIEAEIEGWTQDETKAIELLQTRTNIMVRHVKLTVEGKEDQPTEEKPQEEKTDEKDKPSW